MAQIVFFDYRQVKSNENLKYLLDFIFVSLTDKHNRGLGKISYLRSLVEGVNGGGIEY